MSRSHLAADPAHAATLESELRALDLEVERSHLYKKLDRYRIRD